MSGRPASVILVVHGEAGDDGAGLTGRGENDARRAGVGLRGRPFSLVLCSPDPRSRRARDLAGFGHLAEDEADLLGSPEAAGDLAAGLDRLVARLRQAGGEILAFASPAVLRVLAVRWAGLPIEAARGLAEVPGSVGVLGHDPATGGPVIVLWGDRDFRRGPTARSHGPLV